MKRVSIAELKARLSEFLAVVERGEEVIITDRGRPIAKITQLTGALARDAHIDRLVRAGLMTPPRKKLPRGFLDRPLPEAPDGAVQRAIVEEREEGW